MLRAVAWVSLAGATHAESDGAGERSGDANGRWRLPALNAGQWGVPFPPKMLKETVIRFSVE